MDILAAGRGRPYAEGDALDHRAALVWTVPDVFDAATCARWIDRIDALGPAAAPISTTCGFAMRPDIGNNERVVIDDAALAADLYARVAHAVPPTLADRRAVGANERFRCYRYAPRPALRAPLRRLLRARHRRAQPAHPDGLPQRTCKA